MKRFPIAYMLALPVFLNGSTEADHLRNEGAILSLIDKLALAFTQNDANAIDTLTVEDYSFVSPSGAIETKQQRTAPIRSGDLVYQSVHYDDVRVRCYESTAVATALVSVKSKFKGTEFERSFRSTLTFAKIRGHWRLVASQANAMTRR